MKKLMTIIGLIGVSLSVLNAQESSDTPAVVQFVNNAMSASNYTAVAYATHFDNNKQYGGGFLLLYNIGDYVRAGLGSDYAGEWRMFSGTVNIHKTWQLTSKLSFDTYGLVAAGTSVGGASTDNGSLATGEGGGGHFSYAFTDKFNAGLGGGYVLRQNCGTYSGGSEMITFSLSYKFW